MKLTSNHIMNSSCRALEQESAKGEQEQPTYTEFRRQEALIKLQMKKPGEKTNGEVAEGASADEPAANGEHSNSVENKDKQKVLRPPNKVFTVGDDKKDDNEGERRSSRDADSKDKVRSA